MSLHHAQPDKNRSFGNRESLEGSPQHTGAANFECSSVEASDQETSMSETSSNYDEEARFELLSAYLDDEVTIEEGKLVAQWLMDDPNTQQMYQRLLMLRQAIRTAPVPAQPPVQMPTAPNQPWITLSSWSLRRTLVCAISIALVSSLSQLGTTSGRQQLHEAWQFIKALPQGALLQLASTTEDRVSTKASE